jgi:hypothetical protein
MAKLTLNIEDPEREELVKQNKARVAKSVAKMSEKYEPPKIIKATYKKNFNFNFNFSQIYHKYCLYVYKNI